MGEGENGRLRFDFDTRLRLEFREAKVNTDAGLLAMRELDEALGLTGMAGMMIPKIEWHQRELFPRIDFILTNRSSKTESVVRF